MKTKYHGVHGLSTQLRAARLAAGMSQRQAAELIDVSMSHLSRWENGSEPRAATLAKIAQVYGVKLDQLIQGE